MPAPGKGPGSASGTGGPGSLGGSGRGSLGGNRSGGSGERGTRSQQQDRRNAADRARTAAGDRGTAGQQQDRRNFETARNTGLDAPGVGKAVDAYADRVRDYEDEDNTPAEDAGNVLAGLAGFHELDPEYDPENLNPRADWGFDALGALAGLAGAAFGVPFAGTLVSQAEDALNIRDDLSFNLGPDVFRDDDEVPAGTAMLAGGGDGIDTASGGDTLGGLDDEDTGRDRELLQGMPRKPPKRTPKPAKPKPWSTVGLGDVVSVADWLGV